MTTGTAPKPAAGEAAAAAPAEPAGAPPVPPPPDVSPWRMLGILGGSGAVVGGLIVVAYAWSKPTIDANKARRLDAAVREVLKEPERTEPFEFTPPPPRRPGEDVLPEDKVRVDRVFRGFRKDGTDAGLAVVAADYGFADEVQIIFGFDPATRKVLGFKVLSSKETPGLGDAIEKNEAFVKEFDGPVAPLVGVKKGSSRGQPEHEVDTVTGATISSKTVIRIINGAVRQIGGGEGGR